MKTSILFIVWLLALFVFSFGINELPEDRNYIVIFTSAWAVISMSVVIYHHCKDEYIK